MLFLSITCFGGFECKTLLRDSYDIDVVRRCENSEVVCYFYHEGNRGGLSCKFKEKTRKGKTLSQLRDEEINKQLIPTMVKEGNK
jgi:hypothetical protein